MKSLTQLFLFGLAAVMLVNGAPANDKKVGTNHKLKMSTSTTTISPSTTISPPTTISPFNKCSTVCKTDYKPICGSDGDKINLSFGNKCVLDKYNCEHETKLTVKLNGECPNSKGIRLA